MNKLMKILYVILTCQRYSETRVRWQKNTWVKDVDHIYLKDPAKGYEESYENLSKKYVDFFLDYNFDEYDWLFLCDDDTFVFTNKLFTFLSLCDPDKNTMIGSELPLHFVKKATELNVRSCSGGAGIAISKSLAKNIQEYLRNGDYVVLNEQADVSLAIWCKYSVEDPILFFGCNYFFRPESPKHENNWGMYHPITFHYCDEEDFTYLNNLKW